MSTPRFIVMADATWSTQNARDNALGNLNQAISQYNTKNNANLVADIVLPTNTSIKVTMETGEDDALTYELFNGAYQSWTQVGGRFVSGWMSVNRI